MYDIKIKNIYKIAWYSLMWYLFLYLKCISQRIGCERKILCKKIAYGRLVVIGK
jgi:hypothetical protein